MQTPQPEEIESLVEATTVVISKACQECTGRYEAGKIAGAVYVLTSIIQPFDDGNKQTARLVSGSYLKELDVDARDYAFCFPDHDVGDKMKRVLQPMDFIRNIPAEENIEIVVNSHQELDEDKKNVLREALTEFSKPDGRMEFQELDKIIKKLGGSEDDQTGKSDELGVKIFDRALLELTTAQSKKFLNGVLSNPENFVKMIKGEMIDLNPELKLMEKMTEKYLDALSDVLVDKNHSVEPVRELPM